MFFVFFVQHFSEVGAKKKKKKIKGAMGVNVTKNFSVGGMIDWLNE